MMIINDQGGGSIHCDFQGIANTLRAQMHWYPPLVALEHDELVVINGESDPDRNDIDKEHNRD